MTSVYVTEAATAWHLFVSATVWHLLSALQSGTFCQRNQAQKEGEGKRLCRAGGLVFKKCAG